MRISKPAILVIFLLSSISNNSNGQIEIPAEAIRHYEEGKNLEKQGELFNALEEYKKAIEAAPRYTKAHRSYSDILRDNGKEEEVWKEYKAKVDAEPNNEVYHYIFGRLIADPEGKIIEFKKAIEINPNYFWGYLGMGGTYFSLGRVQEAEQEFQKVLSMQPNLVEALNNLGYLYTEREKYNEAIVTYSKAIEIEPDNIIAHLALGLAYSRKDMYEQAIVEFDKVADLEPTNHHAHYYLGLLYQQIGNYLIAIYEFEKFLAFAPKTDNRIASVESMIQKLRDERKKMNSQ